MEDEENIEEELLLVESELHGLQDKIKMLLDRQEELYERQSQLQALLEISKTSRDAASSAPSVAPEDWSGKFSWDSQADDIRFNVFGISSYRSNQREIINSIMSGKDVLVIMAAGGGKSLCYQLPAVLRDGIALVVSPLLSLIQDQVMGLTALGIPAYMLTSTTNKEVEKLIYKALEKGEGELKILYVTPEKISKSKRFMSKLEKCHHAGRLSLVAIDEAHCCSQWGHDFRPDYKNLGILKIQFPSVPMIALTATATSKVQMDLIEMLHIPRCVKFVSTVNRPNLYYKVYEKSSVGKVVIDEIANFITESYPNKESGIVYCFSRKECEQLRKNCVKGVLQQIIIMQIWILLLVRKFICVGVKANHRSLLEQWHLEWESTNQTSGLWFIIALASLWRHTTRKVVGQGEMDYLQNVFCTTGLVTFLARVRWSSMRTVACKICMT